MPNTLWKPHVLEKSGSCCTVVARPLFETRFFDFFVWYHIMTEWRSNLNDLKFGQDMRYLKLKKNFKNLFPKFLFFTNFLLRKIIFPEFFCFVYKPFLIKNYLLIAAKIVGNRGPLYTCSVSTQYEWKSSWHFRNGSKRQNNFNFVPKIQSGIHVY